ncbi:hypothetical protein K9N68_27775 [Kovacikia minuta CCNUW1]|uniref:hypothetical protein n=1 Tax=Kovacikia minuta TaxID=2931930 RepID=UPI001CCB22CF|nr:hypothetical protein [Kovacikia minuta]UBF25365.1 hypothetical protein K9N68_27775 [Kovacikia minuta CCNUW1]
MNNLSRTPPTQDDRDGKRQKAQGRSEGKMPTLRLETCSAFLQICLRGESFRLNQERSHLERHHSHLKPERSHLEQQHPRLNQEHPQLGAKGVCLKQV